MAPNLGGPVRADTRRQAFLASGLRTSRWARHQRAELAQLLRACCVGVVWGCWEPEVVEDVVGSLRRRSVVVLPATVRVRGRSR